MVTRAQGLVSQSAPDSVNWTLDVKAEAWTVADSSPVPSDCLSEAPTISVYPRIVTGLSEPGVQH